MMERVPTGIAGFDKMAGGGLVKNSANLLSGGPGTGKTIFCLQYLLAGARAGEKCVYFSFEETEAELKEDVADLGMDFSGTEGTLKFVYMPAYTVGNIPALIETELQNFKPARVVIDSVTALTMPMEDEFERRKQIFKIREILKRSGCTSVLVSEVQEENAEKSADGVEEFVCDGFIMLHSAGMGGDGDRAVRIVKMRKTDHVKGPVPVSIGKGGFKVLKKRF